MNIDTLKSTIQNTIKTNGEMAITGQILQTDLLSICDTLNNGKEDTFIKGDGLKLNNGILAVDIVDNTSSTATDKCLSARVGKELDERITNIGARGRFLSTWDCSTGLAGTTPTSLPYNYAKGDYFIVSVTGTTNYIPNGNQYTGIASTTVYTGSVNVNDTILYDGTVWIVMANTQKEIVWESITGDPEDNTALKGLLDAKMNLVTDADPNNVAVFDSSGNVTDGGKSLTDLDKVLFVNVLHSSAVINVADKTYTEVLNAFLAGKTVVANIYENGIAIKDIVYLSQYNSSTNQLIFTKDSFGGAYKMIYFLNGTIHTLSVSYEDNARKIKTLASWNTNKTSTDYYPSAYIVNDVTSAKADKIVETSLVYTASGSYTLNPNVYYVLDCTSAVSGDEVMISLGTSIQGIYNEFQIELTIGTNVPDITLPSGVTWLGGTEPTFAADKVYQISIVRNKGVAVEF